MRSMCSVYDRYIVSKSSSENNGHGWYFLNMSNSSFYKLYCDERTMISAQRAQAFPVNTRVLFVLECGTQWHRNIFATGLLVSSPLEVFLLGLANAVCGAAVLPKSSTWDIALTTSPGGCLIATAVTQATGNLARDLILSLASCLTLFCKAANFVGCRS